MSSQPHGETRTSGSGSVQTVGLGHFLALLTLGPSQPTSACLWASLGWEGVWQGCCL